MRTRRSFDHDAALSRRLAQLGDELSRHRGPGPDVDPDGDLPAVRPARPGPPAAGDPTRASWWDDHTRPAAGRHPERPAPPVSPAPAPLPVGATRWSPSSKPGRHLAPRSRGSSGLGAGQLATVAVLVAGALAVTCWWLVRGAPHAAPDLAAAPAAGLVSTGPVAQPAGLTTDPTPPATEAPATVTVDVAGKVRRPGIVVLDAGARVVDALKAAGGARPGVDLTGLNLARLLVDGEQVVVGGARPSGVAAASAGSGEPAPPSGAPSGPVALVNLNTATEAELDTLPEVGPVTAASILTWRDQHGGFTSVDELLEVDGIGEVTLGRLAPYVTV